MKLKYVVYSNNTATIFPCSINHSDMVEPRFEKVVSAGFVHINPSEPIVECFGESVSLSLKSRPWEDNRIISEMFFNDD